VSRKHSVPTPEEARVRSPNGVDPDVQIACRNCGLFGVQDGQDGCDRWAESTEVQCPKTYGGFRCERTIGHRPGCEMRVFPSPARPPAWFHNVGLLESPAAAREWIGVRVLDRLSWFDAPGSVLPDSVPTLAPCAEKDRF
jgi:hypothetical protein